MNHPRALLRARALSLALALILLPSACDSAPAATLYPTPVRGPTATAQILVSVAIVGPTPTLTPPPGDGTEGLLDTLATFTDTARLGFAQQDALLTLADFANTQGVYHSAWWLVNDGQADIYEALAVIQIGRASCRERV